jgi:hypothetical protein
MHGFPDGLHSYFQETYFKICIYVLYGVSLIRLVKVQAMKDFS